MQCQVGDFPDWVDIINISHAWIYDAFNAALVEVLVYPLANVDAHAVVYGDNRGPAGDELQENDSEAVNITLLTDVVTAVIPA